MRFPSTNMSRPLQGLRRPVSQTSLGALQGTITVGIQVAGKFGYPTANIWWKYFQTSELFFNVSHNVCRARLAALVLLEVDFTSPSNKGPLPISFVEHAPHGSSRLSPQFSMVAEFRLGIQRSCREAASKVRNGRRTMMAGPQSIVSVRQEE